MTERIRNTHARELYTLALDDASTLDFPLPDAIYGFHAQQSFEKAMKALISTHATAYPFDHNLKALINILRSCGEELPVTAFDLLTLQPYAVQLRYTIDGGLDEEERASMKQAVLFYNQHVFDRILKLEAAPSL